jgi:hypothetical protein
MIRADSYYDNIIWEKDYKKEPLAPPGVQSVSIYLYLEHLMITEEFVSKA